MLGILGPNVTMSQGLLVTSPVLRLSGMSTLTILEAFAARLNEVCDDLDIPKEHGRQSALGRLMGVSPKAARKWLTGQGFPEMETAIRIAQLANINVNWLLQGVGPKKNDDSASVGLVLTEGITALAEEDKLAVIDYMKYKFGSSTGWFAEDRKARYLGAIEDLKKKH